jgi:hypothetical protein
MLSRTMVPDPDPPVEHTEGSLSGLPLGTRLGVIAGALRKSAGERRTKRALFFCSASLMVGFTVGDLPGLLVCGFFGGSLYLVVLVLRMQRHLAEGARKHQAE